MKKILILLILIFNTKLSAAPAEGNIIDLPLVSTTLENGLKVYVLTDKATPFITQVITYKVGSRNDPPYKTGLAHFLEHLIFRGTKENRDFSDQIIKKGGTFNGFTNAYNTVYYITLLKEHLELAIKLEADRMRNLEINPAEADLERKIVLAERRQRLETLPINILDEHLQHTLFYNMSWQTAGWGGDISNLTVADAQNMYDTYYYPSNAILLIVGDVTLKDLSPYLKKYYGNIPDKAVPAQKFFPSTSFPLKIFLKVQSFNPPSNVLRYYRAPNYNSEHFLPFSIATYAIGYKKNNRLFTKLTEESKFVNDVDLGYGWWEPENNFLNIDVQFKNSPLTNTEFSEMISNITTALDNVFNEVSSKGITATELKRAKSTFKLSLLKILASQNDAKAIFLSKFFALGYDEEYIQNLLKTIDQIPLEAVNASIKSFLGNGAGYVEGIAVNNQGKK